jgi:protein TonB
VSETARIIDVVFASAPRRRSSGAALGIAAGVAAHALLLAWALLAGPSLGAWAAAVAVRVHSELARTEVVEHPPPVPPPKPEPDHEEPLAAGPKAVAPRAPGHEHRRTALHQPPAQAGQVVARNDPAPADFGADTFVTGNATTYGGGATRSDGTSDRPVDPRDVSGPDDRPNAPAPATAAEAKPDLSQPVGVDADWTCPWPSGADPDVVDDPSAIIRVTVRIDGSVESASVEQDPGHGFGRAAVECALGRKFSPARDRDGKPIQASALVLVHFR